MILDTALELTLPPPTVVISPSVNPTPPTSFLVELAPDGLHTYLAGPAYSGALWKLVRPSLPTTGRLTLSFDWQPDAALLALAQACEFDCRPTDAAGNTYPMDSQLNLAEGAGSGTAMLQVWNGGLTGKWTDTGLKIALPPAAQWTTLTFNYAFDQTHLTCSVVSLTVGTGASVQTYVVPGQLQSQPVERLGWQPGQTVIQKQLDMGALGGGAAAGAFSDVMRGITLGWG